MPTPITGLESTELTTISPLEEVAQPMAVTGTDVAQITPNTTIDELLANWPERASILLSYRLPAVGKTDEEQAEAWTSGPTVGAAAARGGLVDADLARLMGELNGLTA